MSRLTIEQLEDYRNTYDKYEGIDTNKFEEICDELIKYKQLQDELGCPLEVIFKALKEGIYFNFNRTCKEEFIEPIDLSLRYSLGGFYCFYFEQWNDGYEVDLRYYGKTWWLKGDRRE